MQNELDIPDPCPGAVYVLQSSHLLFNPLSFSVTFFLSIVFLLSGWDLLLRSVKSLKTMLNLCLGLLVLSNWNMFWASLESTVSCCFLVSSDSSPWEMSAGQSHLPFSHFQRMHFSWIGFASVIRFLGWCFDFFVCNVPRLFWLHFNILCDFGKDC